MVRFRASLLLLPEFASGSGLFVAKLNQVIKSKHSSGEPTRISLRAEIPLACDASGGRA